MRKKTSTKFSNSYHWLTTSHQQIRFCSSQIKRLRTKTFWKTTTSSQILAQKPEFVRRCALSTPELHRQPTWRPKNSRFFRIISTKVDSNPAFPALWPSPKHGEENSCVKTVPRWESACVLCYVVCPFQWGVGQQLRFLRPSQWLEPQDRDKVCRNIGRIMRLLLVVNLATEQQSQSNNALIRCYLFAFWFLLSNLKRTNEREYWKLRTV